MGAKKASRRVTGADWIPDLLPLSDFEASEYLDQIYRVFREELLVETPYFQGRPVVCRRDPIFDGKEAGFWHCVSEGREEEMRMPDMKRCERIRWIKAVLTHAMDPRIEIWTKRRGRDERVHVWFDESYLIVLGKRKKYYQLITAFCTDREHTKRNKRKERDACKNG